MHKNSYLAQSKSMRFITHADARAAGISRRTLQGSAFQRVLTGIYAPATVSITLHNRVAAARLVLPDDACVTGNTLLNLANISYGSSLPLTFATRGRSCRKEIRIIPRRREHGDAALAPLAVALVDSALPMAETIAIADILLRKRLVTISELAHQPTLVQLIPLLDARAESKPESKLRVMLVTAGLPVPNPQYVVTVAGNFLARLDLAWEEFRVAVEYEGIHHATDPEQWAKDIERYRHLESLGWTVLRITSQHMRNPASVVTMVYSARYVLMAGAENRHVSIAAGSLTSLRLGNRLCTRSVKEPDESTQLSQI
ncbi:MAG: endonuclease domain-containing protein [Propionibacteriaceae bacterium]